MVQITEIFVMKMKDVQRAEAVRETARRDFEGIDGVTAWKTYASTSPDKPKLFAEIFTFPDMETAKAISPTFADRPATKAFLEEIDEILVGQYFAPHVANGE